MISPRFLSPAVRTLSAFGGVPTSVSLTRDGSAHNPVLLHLNECPYPPSPLVIEAVSRAVASVNRYGDPRPGSLAALIASRNGFPPPQVVIGNGSDEILGLVPQMALGPGDNAVMPTPSFPRYRLGTRAMGAEARMVLNLDDGRNDVAGLLAAIDANTKVVFACTPNNPSGAPLPQDEIRALVQGVPEDVLLVVDEAYYEFDAAQGGIGALPELRGRRGPWLSTRTLSKAYSIAGLRIGYGLAGSPEVADGLVRVKLNFNLSCLAVVAAEAALSDEAYAQGCIAKALAERGRVSGLIEKMGYRTLPSRANFVSFDYGPNAASVIAHLAAQGIFLREWRDPGYATFIRMTIGLPQENDRALAAVATAA